MSRARERTRQAQGKSEKAGYPVFKVTVEGEEVVVDQNTFTGTERQVAKRELARLGYEPDNEDRMVAAIWVTLRRVTPDLSFAEFLDTITVGDWLAAEDVDAAEDTSPEA